ncbi:MAG TPA: CPCC family cysteine-rich protein [Thermoanaerobaculia bacterium]|nr:CPCC family cysteine-rich protein [Thermoanaerobaculia bacterium]
MERCPCCNYRTLTELNAFEMCPVCFWEDDGQSDSDTDEVRGGPNGELSLTEARRNFRMIGAMDPRFLKNVRRPTASEL